ncbi:unnamed protein product [Durusdinium trenchii]|uniref:C3H1-type domain-containing protein n=2 Tax=Durusdinium trenchii TaxID=1381693 RepID=A0ABP0IND9_9DINO
MHTCRPSSRLEEPLSGIEVAGAFGEGGGPRAADAGVSGARLIDRQPWTPSHLILFARGTCKQGSDCKFCHSLHVGRPASLDAQQRALIASWSLAKLLDAVLPHLKKATGVALHPGSAHLLELVQRELDLRKTTITTRMALAGFGPVPHRLRNVFRRMSLSALVSVVCSKSAPSPFSTILKRALNKLRREVGEGQ